MWCLGATFQAWGAASTSAPATASLASASAVSHPASAASDCLPPAAGLRDVNGDGVISLGIVGASNTTGRLHYADPPARTAPVPPIWDFPSTAEGVRAALEPNGVIVQWNAPYSLEWGVTVNYVQRRTTFTQIDWILENAAPPVDAILVGSGLDGSAGEVVLGLHTMEDVKKGITQLIIDSLPGQLTAMGYDLYLLTQTRTIDCDCGRTNACRCCTDPAWTCQTFYGPWDDVAARIDEVNAYLRKQTATVIDAGVIDTTGSVDYIHHGPRGVAQKVTAVTERLIDPAPGANHVPKRCEPQILHCLDGTLVCPEDDANACTAPRCDPIAGCLEELVPDGVACPRTAGCTAGECRAGACVASTRCEVVEVAPVQVVSRLGGSPRLRATCVGTTKDVCQAQGFFIPRVDVSATSAATTDGIGCPEVASGAILTKRVRRRIEGHPGEARLALKLNRAGRCLLRRSGPEGIDVRVRVTVHRRNEPEPRSLDFQVHVVAKSRKPANEQHRNAWRAHARAGR
jgi:hypothetical protein